MENAASPQTTRAVQAAHLPTQTPECSARSATIAPSQRAHRPAAHPKPKSATAEVEHTLGRKRSAAAEAREKTDGAPNQNYPNTLKLKACGVSGWPRWATLTRRQAEPVLGKKCLITERR